MSLFLEKKYPQKSFSYNEIPSMNDPSEQVLKIAEKVGEINSSEPDNSAVFVTAGSSTIAMSLWYHSRFRYWISLRNELILKIWDKMAIVEPKSILVDGGQFTLGEILSS